MSSNFFNNEGNKWPKVKLGDVFDIQQGASLSPKRREGNSLFPFLRTLNVLWGKIDLSTIDYMNFSEIEIRRLQLLPNDLLICEGGDIGRTAVWNGEFNQCFFQNHLHRLRAKTEKIDPFFIAYWMYAAIKMFGLYVAEGNKTTIPNLSKSRLSNFEIPLPPLEEQQAIARTLRTVQEAQERTEAVIEATENLKAAMKRHLFTNGPVPIEQYSDNDTPNINYIKNGKSGRFDDFFVLQRGFDITKEEQSDGKIPVVSSSGIKSYHNQSKVKGPGVVIGRKGTLGSVFYLKDEYWPHDTTLWIKDFKGNHPLFVYYFLSTLKLKSLDTGTSNPTLNRNYVHSLNISIPEISNQITIAKILCIIDEKISIEKNRGKKLEELFKSLLISLLKNKIESN